VNIKIDVSWHNECQHFHFATQLRVIMSVTAPALASTQTPRRSALTLRRILLLGSGFVLILALLVIVQAVNAYQTSYNLFRDIAVVNSANVDAAEQALGSLASTGQATADYTALSPDSPIFEQAMIGIFRNFYDFRDQMFVLQGNLQSDAERSAFNIADTYVDSRFWRHISNLMLQRSNIELARKQYRFADDHLRNQIIPALQDLEAINFDQMVETGELAGGIMNVQTIGLAVLVIGLAAALSVLSFWLRGKIRRYLTPGIDAAMVIAWVLAVLMLLNLFGLPEQLRVMIQDSYRSISASSRVLVDVNLANRAESSAVIFPDQADAWFARYDDYMELVELRMCGYVGCVETTFVTGSDQLDPLVVASAHAISPEDSDRIGNIVPLVGNVTFSGEAITLEAARMSLLEYKRVNQQLRELIAAGDVEGALELNTGDEGVSAFDDFVNMIENERVINRQVFDRVWEEQQAALPANQTLYGVLGIVAVMALVIAGVYHRYQEL
jgi:hypothetical protein